LAQYPILEMICFDTSGRGTKRDSPHALRGNDTEESIFVAGCLVRLVCNALAGDRDQHMVVFVESRENDIRHRRRVREDDAHMRREVVQNRFIEGELDALWAVEVEIAIAKRAAIVGWILVITIHGIDQGWSVKARRKHPVLTRHAGGIEQMVF